MDEHHLTLYRPLPISTVESGARIKARAVGIIWLAATLGCGLGRVDQAAAQTIASPPLAKPPNVETKAEEVTVTAQKRRQRIQDVPIAVTVLGARNLAALGRRDINALPSQVPGLQVQAFAPTVTIFNIRGVSQNDYTDSEEAPVAFYNDDVYISATGAIDGMTYDLDRVEVLRGPQGTLFGRNATGGLIQVITAKPTDKFSAFETTTFGSFGQFATEGAVSGPINDWLRARVSFTSNDHGGYVQNTIGPDTGAANFYGARVQLAGDLTDVDAFNLKAELLSNNNEHSPGAYTFAAAVPNADGLGKAFGKNENPFGTGGGEDPFGYASPSSDPFIDAENAPNVFNRKFLSFTGHYTHDFGGFTLTSISNFQRLRKNYEEDSDESPADLITYSTFQNLYQLSEELRLNGKVGRLTWTTGVYGIGIHTDNTYNENFDFIDDKNRYGGTLNTESVAGFEQSEYALTDQLTAIVGARYSNDWKADYYTHATNGITDYVFNPTVDGDLARRNDGAYSGKLQLTYKPNTDALFYIGINRGTKSGGFSTPLTAPFDAAAMSFKPEKLTDYEGGAKLTLPDGRSHLNGTVFYYDYRDYQAFVYENLSIRVSNQNAVIKGAEVEVDTRPVHGVYLQAFSTFLDGIVHDLELPTGRIANTRMPNSPRLSVGGLASYTLPVGPGRLSLETDWKYDSIQYFTAFNAPDDLERPRLVGNVRTTYDFGKIRHWELAFFINNVTNKYYRVYNGDASALGFDQQVFFPPRWFGGSVTLRL